MKKYIAELIGTFGLVFAGTGAIIVNDITNGTITHVGVAITFGLIVMTMIYAIGDISGAHINPAVTLGFCLARLISWKEAIKYILFQITGALLASLFLRLAFPVDTSLGITVPSISPFYAFVFEIILTFFLMFVIMQVTTGAKEKGLMAGIAIGATVGLGSMFAGPITGASMNPARSLAPALISGNFQNIWIYLTAPLIGAALAIVVSLYLAKHITSQSS